MLLADRYGTKVVICTDMPLILGLGFCLVHKRIGVLVGSSGPFIGIVSMV